MEPIRKVIVRLNAEFFSGERILQHLYAKGYTRRACVEALRELNYAVKSVGRGIYVSSAPIEEEKRREEYIKHYFSSLNFYSWAK
ncbi:MAG: hypothetical protein UU78_C0080G0004 [Candidatus Roizmanbacteria bacterium GW2011_GWC2_41_7]|uniref:Uncharacterized protein n=1 Tax=Candidatus Roizmanbacteria bacterium GW2011_GWC2_41_7 TaxID=1618487 RepID=A0A0G0X3H1_9BACT|nr:MAG: hypothetical protein UU78_C0080G0004 [Candidatus Roizmanbacteria bacterium GW2011_GWC2_41_7]